MTSSQIRCLLAVRELTSSRASSVASKDIAERIGVSRPSVHRLLDGLDKAGLVQKIHYGPVLMTEKGITEADRLLERCQRLAGSLTGSFSLSDEESLNAAILLMSGLHEDSLRTIESA